MADNIDTRYRLIREEAIKKLIEDTPLKDLPLENPIRQLPLDKAYPSKHDYEAMSDFYLRINEYTVEVGRIINEEVKFTWRGKRIHIMHLNHALCRKNNIATSYGKRFILEWKIWEIRYKERKKYRYNFQFCSGCNKLFWKHHEKMSGLF